MCGDTSHSGIPYDNQCDPSHQGQPKPFVGPKAEFDLGGGGEAPTALAPPILLTMALIICTPIVNLTLPLLITLVRCCADRGSWN